MTFGFFLSCVILGAAIVVVLWVAYSILALIARYFREAAYVFVALAAVLFVLFLIGWGAHVAHDRLQRPRVELVS